MYNFLILVEFLVLIQLAPSRKSLLYLYAWN